MQNMLEQWVYRWNLRCMLKGDITISTYGTCDLPLLERVKQAAVYANYGIDPFPLWQPITLLGEDRAQWPSFGLEVVPKSQLADATAAAGVGESLLALQSNNSACSTLMAQASMYVSSLQ